MKRKIVGVFVLVVAMSGIAVARPSQSAIAAPPWWQCTGAIDGQHVEDDEVPGAYWGCDAMIGHWVIVDWTPEDEVEDRHSYSASGVGCVHNYAAIQRDSALNNVIYGRSMVVSEFYPCHDILLNQPPLELRARVVMQRWNGSSWVGCVDTGYYANSTTRPSFHLGFSMGTAPDCGAGTYRTVGYGRMNQGGAWRGTSVTTGSIFIP